MPLYLAFLGFYSTISIIASYLIVSYNDYDLLKRFKAARRARSIDKLKAGQLVFLSSIIQYTKE